MVGRELEEVPFRVEKKLGRSPPGVAVGEGQGPSGRGDAARPRAVLAAGGGCAGLAPRPGGDRASIPEVRAPSPCSFVRSARRQRTLLASPPAKSAVNGNLLEPRSLLEGPDPAELLLMGSYLGKPGPPQPASTPEARDVRERPGRRPPARTAAPALSAHPHRVHTQPSLPTPLLRPSRRPSHR